MSTLFDFNPKPDSYAVMGNPISHSKSPFIHNKFAEQTKQNITYTAIQVDPGGFAQAVGNFQASGGKGLNITIPFKQEAWELVDERSVRAEQAGAVNTIVCRPDNTLFGDNTDGVGMLQDITQNHGGQISERNVLIIGAGGAVRGVLAPLLEQQPSRLVIANRTVDNAETLAVKFQDMGKIIACGFSGLQGMQFDLVINGTSASLKGEVPPLPNTIIAQDGWCYDMMYGADPTVFMRWAKQHGAVVVLDGLGMLVQQAAESFYIWRGVRPDTKPVIDALRQELQKSR
jgi:shikimate dehydrogenase